MAWIAWVKGLTQREEVLRIAGRLDIDPKLVAACCMLIWEWADSETNDGATKVTLSRFICHADNVTGVTGFGAAFAEVGWAVENGTGTSFPNFTRWNGETAKNRLQNAARQTKWRNKRYKSNDSNVMFSLPEKRREESVKTHGALQAPLWNGRHVEAVELSDPKRLQALHREFVTAGIVSGSENDRLDFVALAVGSVRLGKSNAVGLFRKRMENFERSRTKIAARDDDAANRIVKTWDGTA